MIKITIKASVGNGLDKVFVGDVVRDFPSTLDEAKSGEWKHQRENDDGPFTEEEALHLMRRSFVIDVQREMRPAVANEKAKQMTILQQKALTDPKLAAMLVAADISVKPTKENGLLADPSELKQ